MVKKSLRRTYPLFLGLPLAAGLMRHDFINWIINRSTSSEGQALVCYLNAWTTVLAQDDPELAKVYRECDLLYADGESVVRAARSFGISVYRRLSAGDLILDFLKGAAKQGIRIGLYGGRPGVAERAAEAWGEATPGLQVVICADGYGGGAGVAGEVAAAGVDLLLVGMGSPRQELWAREHGAATGARVIWCVGALFEYFGEGRPRAPRWMQRSGLEWLFRLALEPRRMWRRYLVGNLRFIWLVWRAGGFRGRRGRQRRRR